MECAVADLIDVDWNPESFESLKIDGGIKKILFSLASARLRIVEDVLLEDFVKGKGRGLNVLLQYVLSRAPTIPPS